MATCLWAWSSDLGVTLTMGLTIFMPATTFKRQTFKPKTGVQKQMHALLAKRPWEATYRCSYTESILRCDTYSKSIGWGSSFHHSRVWSTRKNSSSVAVSTYFLIVRRSLYATKYKCKTRLNGEKTTRPFSWRPFYVWATSEYVWKGVGEGGGFLMWVLSRNFLFEHINTLQCYELIRRCSPLPLMLAYAVHP